MKLHLPCALRGALLACFAVVSTTTAYAAWDGNSYIITNAATESISTADGTADSNGIFIRSTSGGTATADIQAATIGTLTIANDRVNLQGHWSAPTTNAFTALTLMSTVLAEGQESANLNVYEYNTVYLGTASSTVASEVLGAGITVQVNGTLCMNYALWEGLADQIVGVSSTDSATYGGSEATAGGTISFFGSIDATKYDLSGLTQAGDSITFENVVGGFDASSVAKDNLTFEFSQTGWTVEKTTGFATDLEWQEDGTANLTVTYIGVGRQEIYPDGYVPVEAPSITADYIASAETANTLTQITENWDVGEDDWAIQLHGVTSAPTEKDLILISNTDSKLADSYSSATDLARGDFAIYATTDGKLMLFHSSDCSSDEEATKGTMATYWQIGTLGTDWAYMEFSLNISYNNPSSYYQILMNNQLSYIVLYDADGNVLRTSLDLVDSSGNSLTDSSLLKYGYINVSKKIPADDLVDSVYTSLPEGSYVSLTNPSAAPAAGEMPIPSITVTPDAVYWYIVENAEANLDGLWRGDYLDYDTKQGTKMVDSDTLVFTGGGLTTDDADEARTLVLANDILVQDVSADEAGVKLAPGKNTTILVTNGEQALTTKAEDGTKTFHGLEIGGAEGSSVVLAGVSSTTPENITVKAGAALAFSGSDTYTIDANITSINIDEAASLGVQGGGTLVFRGKEEGGSTIHKLFTPTGASGTVKVENDVTATTVEADKLTITAAIAATEETPKQEAATLHVTEGITANTINTGAEASLSTAASITATNITLGTDSTVTAAKGITATGGTIYVGSGAALTAGEALTVATLNVGGSATEKASATAKVVNASGSITVAGTESSLTAESISAASGGIRLDGTANTLTASESLTARFLQVEKGGNTIDVGDGTLNATVFAYSYGSSGISNSNFTITAADPTSDSSCAVFNALYDEAGNITTNALAIDGGTLAAGKATNAIITVKGTSIAAFSLDSSKVISLGTASNVTIISEEGDVTISDTQFTDSSVTVTNGSLTLDSTTYDADTQISVTGVGAQIDLSDTVLSKGTELALNGATFTVNDSATLATPEAVTLSGSVSGSTLTLTALSADITNLNAPQDGELTVTLLTSQNGDISANGCNYSFIYAPGMGMAAAPVVDDNGTLSFTLGDVTREIMAELATHENAATASTALTDTARATGGTMLELFNHLRDTSQFGLAERRAVLDQLSSGSVAMLADSQRRGVANTISTLRNRVIQMGNVQGFEPESHVHAWIQADGAYNDIDQDGNNAGYEYQSWGGTVGAHVDTGDFSFGAAISAAYGDLTAHSTDRAEGNLDTISASIFIRHQSGPVTQMGILSFGSNELETERTVHTYKAEGEASGYTITAYYEAGYTFVLNEEGTHVLQPVVSAMLTAAHMGEFTETGTIGNAGFIGEEQDYFYGTVGIGARYQAVLGTDVNDRIAFFEARARVVADFGDDTHEATVSFTGAPGTTFTQYGAEVGKVGVQIGAGVSIPFGIYKTLFADVDADFRDCATSVSGSMGIRFEF